MTVVEPTADVVEKYRAPYPDQSLTIGSRAFTQLLPTRLDNPMYPANHEAWKILDRWTNPVLTIFSDKDIGAQRLEAHRAADPWQGQPHVILEGGGHLLREDIPEAYNRALLDWLGPAPPLRRFPTMTSEQPRYTLYGAPVSLYTGKARSYPDPGHPLCGGESRQQAVSRTHRAHGRPMDHSLSGDPQRRGRSGRRRHHRSLRKGRRPGTAALLGVPDSPMLLAISHLFELFGGEGLPVRRCTIGGTSTRKIGLPQQ